MPNMVARLTKCRLLEMALLRQKGTALPSCVADMFLHPRYGKQASGEQIVAQTTPNVAQRWRGGWPIWVWYWRGCMGVGGRGHSVIGVDLAVKRLCTWCCNNAVVRPCHPLPLPASRRLTFALPVDAFFATPPGARRQASAFRRESALDYQPLTFGARWRELTPSVLSKLAPPVLRGNSRHGRGGIYLSVGAS
ncbi:MAG: hypothetical protein IPL28_26775 [Chloroflexi bacterium]|nr:hypothetical protein [Chloroflexota bacterium]